jgi:TolB-like protein/DNA-binding winged helix-turn-helix (wHTH) protein/Tfp pilus assembly protein PilF
VNSHQDSESARYRFGLFELDARAGELRKQGLLVRLQGQPLQILLALLERPGVIVTRDELRQRLWPGDTFVEFDHSLNTAIKRLRETLGDTATTPRFIETAPRRGYRFLGPVERLPDVAYEQSRLAGAAVAGDHNGSPGARSTPSSEPPSEPAPEQGALTHGRERTEAAASASTALPSGASAQTLPPPSRGRAAGSFWSDSGSRRAVAVALMLVIGVAATLFLLTTVFRLPASSTSEASATPRLAVLPFENLTGDPSRAHVAEGFTEELVAQLGRLAPGRLGVIARSSSASFKTPDTPLGEIAHALSVDYVIEGSVRGEGDRYRVAIRLVRTRDLTALWSELYEGTLLDLVSMQRDVGQQVARRLALALLPADQAALARATTADSRAYESYLRGLSEMARGPSEGFARATEDFQRAIAADPRYALAHAALAESYIFQEDYYVIEPVQAQAAAKAAALGALAIDDGLAEGHCALASVLSRTAGESAAADREFARALALNPSRAATQVRYASHLIQTSRVQEGRDRLEQARILAPRSADVITEMAWMEMNAGRLDTASALAADALRYQPEFPFARYVLGQVALRRAAPQDAIAQFEFARVTSGQAPKYIYALATAYLAAARPADAARALAELRAQSQHRYVPPGIIESLATRLGSQSARRSN